MQRIRIAIAGVGNRASLMIQDLQYYKSLRDHENVGLLYPKMGNWSCSDIEPVAAFDIDRRKVGRPLEEAIFALPNCTKVFHSILPVSGVKVSAQSFVRCYRRASAADLGARLLFFIAYTFVKLAYQRADRKHPAWQQHTGQFTHLARAECNRAQRGVQR